MAASDYNFHESIFDVFQITVNLTIFCSFTILDFAKSKKQMFTHVPPSQLLFNFITGKNNHEKAKFIKSFERATKWDL